MDLNKLQIRIAEIHKVLEQQQKDIDDIKKTIIEIETVIEGYILV